MAAPAARLQHGGERRGRNGVPWGAAGGARARSGTDSRTEFFSQIHFDTCTAQDRPDFGASLRCTRPAGRVDRGKRTITPLRPTQDEALSLVVACQGGIYTLNLEAMAASTANSGDSWLQGFPDKPGLGTNGG